MKSGIQFSLTRLTVLLSVTGLLAS